MSRTIPLNQDTNGTNTNCKCTEDFGNVLKVVILSLHPLRAYDSTLLMYTKMLWAPEDWTTLSILVIDGRLPIFKLHALYARRNPRLQRI